MRIQDKVAIVTGGGSGLGTNAVLFLVSDEASFIAGQTLYVDGGRTDRM